MSNIGRRRRIYLAGPEVFLPTAASLGAEKRRLAEAAGFEGVFPHDADVGLPSAAQPQRPSRIFAANIERMRSCDALIANLTPFRGVSADAGTVFEVGFMCALGRPVSAYTNCTQSYHARAQTVRARRSVPEDCDRPDCAVEDYDLADNLMIEMAVISSGGVLVRQQGGGAPDMADLAGFRQCLDLIGRAWTA
jgi:nucleoside 2-deoxyribosyltransferase